MEPSKICVIGDSDSYNKFNKLIHKVYRGEIIHVERREDVPSSIPFSGKREEVIIELANILEKVSKKEAIYRFQEIITSYQLSKRGFTDELIEEYLDHYDITGMYYQNYRVETMISRFILGVKFKPRYYPTNQLVIGDISFLHFCVSLGIREEMATTWDKQFLSRNMILTPDVYIYGLLHPLTTPSFQFFRIDWLSDEICPHPSQEVKVDRLDKDDFIIYGRLAFERSILSSYHIDCQSFINFLSDETHTKNDCIRFGLLHTRKNPNLCRIYEHLLVRGEDWRQHAIKELKEYWHSPLV